MISKIWLSKLRWVCSIRILTESCWFKICWVRLTGFNVWSWLNGTASRKDLALTLGKMNFSFGWLTKRSSMTNCGLWALIWAKLNKMSKKRMMKWLPWTRSWDKLWITHKLLKHFWTQESMSVNSRLINFISWWKRWVQQQKAIGGTLCLIKLKLSITSKFNQLMQLRQLRQLRHQRMLLV